MDDSAKITTMVLKKKGNFTVVGSFLVTLMSAADLRCKSNKKLIFRKLLK